MTSRRHLPPPTPADTAPGRSVELRVRGDLDDFLPERLRGRVVARRIDGSPGVKDVIEALGIPHPEVDVVLVNGDPVSFAHRVAPGDRIEVRPATGHLGPPAELRAGPPALPIDRTRFVLDGHLGRLAAYLRMAGFDSWYERDAPDEALARISAEEDRILLTRDVGLLRRGIVVRGAFVRSDRPREQLVEILARFGLVDAIHPFGRCLRCNGELAVVDPGSVRDEVPPRVLREQAEFRRCPACGGVYWRGSHHRRMDRLLAEAVDEARAALEASVAEGRPERAARR